MRRGPSCFAGCTLPHASGRAPERCRCGPVYPATSAACPRARRYHASSVVARRRPPLRARDAAHETRLASKSRRVADYALVRFRRYVDVVNVVESVGGVDVVVSVTAGAALGIEGVGTTISVVGVIAPAMIAPPLLPGATHV